MKIFIKNNEIYLITQHRAVEIYDLHFRTFIVGNLELNYEIIKLSETHVKPFLLYTLPNSRLSLF